MDRQVIAKSGVSMALAQLEDGVQAIGGWKQRFHDPDDAGAWGTHDHIDRQLESLR